MMKFLQTERASDLLVSWKEKPRENFDVLWFLSFFPFCSQTQFWLRDGSRRAYTITSNHLTSIIFSLKPGTDLVNTARNHNKKWDRICSSFFVTIWREDETGESPNFPSTSSEDIVRQMRSQSSPAGARRQEQEPGIEGAIAAQISSFPLAFASNPLRFPFPGGFSNFMAAFFPSPAFSSNALRLPGRFFNFMAAVLKPAKNQWFWPVLAGYMKENK
jgi:hypothetical protein